MLYFTLMKKEALGKYIAERRKSLHINQRELADLCGVSEHALVNLERGNGNPTFDLIDKVCEAMGLEIGLAPKVMEA